MQVAEEIAHVAPGDLRIPVVDSGKQPEQDARRDHVVEVADHIVGVVQMEIRKVESQRQTGETTDPKHG